VLSTNLFTRLGALSNHTEIGSAQVGAGSTVEIKFKRPFDLPTRVVVTPLAPAGVRVLARELTLENERMIVGTSMVGAANSGFDQQIAVNYIVYGLVDIDKLPTWRIQYFAAASQLANRLFKPALFGLCDHLRNLR
jgi:hypothetical protein